MRKTFGAVALVLLLLAMTVPVGAQVTDTTLPPVDSTSRPPATFTICHFAGLAGTEMFVELTLPFVAIFGQAGHFFENGTPRAGHEQDIFGPCPATTTSTTTTTTSTTTTTTTTTLPTTTTTEPPVVTPFCVDVNTATQAELEELDGINALFALAIIAGRPYESVQDLADVLPPGVLALILIANAQTGAFADDTCLTPAGTTTSTTTTLPEETTTTTTIPGSTSTLTIPPSPPTTLGAGEITAVCVSDIPFLSYEILDFPEGTLLSEIRFNNPTGGPDVVYVDQPLSGQVLWPGASDIPPFDWPGWELVNGVWVEADDGFLWARETVSITFTINPSVTISVDYPPASSICANPSNLNPNLPSAPRTPSPGDGELPFTGINLGYLGTALMALLGLGTLLVLAVREDD